MLITAVQIRNIQNENRLRGIASITLSGMIVIHDIKIIQQDEYYFLAMPSKKIPNGTFKDVAHPISAPVRESLERILFGGVDYMLRNNLSYISMNLLPDTGKTSLLEENYEDFVVDEDNTFREVGRPVQEVVVAVREEPKEEAKDDFLKWLEE